MTLQPRNLYSEVLDGLRKMIENGEIREGERIPTERVLAERFGVSRTCVREALGALKLSGVIQGRPGAGTYLAKVSPVGLAKSNLLLVEEGSPFEILESRKIIEPAIASLAARKATEKDIARLAEAMERLHESAGDPEALTQADRQFHMCMAEATHNRILIRTLGQILDLMQRIYYPAVGIVGPQDGYYDSHNEVFTHVRRRNSRGAERAMRAHLLAVELDLESLSDF